MAPRAALMPQVFQIHEESLAELERILPQISEALVPVLTPRLKTKLRHCKTILSDVRWDYGPPLESEAVSDD